jgi:hypothetical protein
MTRIAANGLDVNSAIEHIKNARPACAELEFAQETADASG